jgi:nuclear transport factor 2 (NTF2) superfamily protein
MQQIPAAFNFMLDAWNERDLDQIRPHVDKCIAENVVFADPSNFIQGREGFAEMIQRFRQKYPDSITKRTSGIDSHNNRYRYTWEIYVGEMLIVKGFDVAQVNESGLVERVDGFFGDFPPLGS